MHIIGTSARPDLPLAVIAGAGALGMAMARRMAQHYRVLLADIDAERTEANAATMRAEGCDAAAFACDVTDPDAVMALADEVGARGGLGALVYVAGLSPSAAGFEAIMRVNLIGAARICEVLLPHTRPGSAAVLISSLAAHGLTPNPELQELLRDAARRRSARAAGHSNGRQGHIPDGLCPIQMGHEPQYARRAAAAWGARGARIVSLSPGLIATPMGALEFEKSAGKKAMYEKTPLQRECTMLEIADALEFLVSARASFISGTDLLVDGGLHAVMSEG